MLTITRKDLLLTINDNVIPAMGSSDVPVKFKYKNNGTDGYSIGFIANEIEDKIKSLKIDIDYYNFIKINEDILSLAYSEFIAINTYMIKKCMKRIDYLEEKIKSPKGEA